MKSLRRLQSSARKNYLKVIVEVFRITETARAATLTER
jgi:hypothetical protein